MSKLKLIKERNKKSAENPVNDLRSLGDEDIFLNASPYACLSVHGNHDPGIIHSITEKYGLEKEQSSHAKVVHLHFHHRHEGEHKIQAIALFVAGLDINQKIPNLHLFLSQISRLHQHIEKGIIGNQHHSDHSPDAKISEWLVSPHSYSMESVITWHLHQAGFPIQKSNTTHHLNQESINAIMTSIHPQENKHSIERVG